MSESVPSILYLCVHNAGRSQMAAGWTEHLAREGAIVLSGGSEPAEDVNAAAVEVMREVGIDIASHRPRRWSDTDLASADVVVTMGCGDECPFVPGTRYLDWLLPDPAGMDLAGVRDVRDEIGLRVRELLSELGLPAGTG